jgi:hypothetical protein
MNVAFATLLESFSRGLEELQRMHLSCDSLMSSTSMAKLAKRSKLQRPPCYVPAA